MAYLGWISGAVGVVVGYVGGTLTTFYAGKYSFDKANEVKELIVTARRFISDFEDRPTIYRQYHRQRFSWKWFEISKLASSLFGEYGFIRLLRLVRLPSKAGCRRGG